MQESHLENKQMILNTKLNTSSPDFQIMKSLQTSDLELTLKEKDYKPYWTSCLKEISKNLWLPIKTDYVDLGLTYSNTCLSNMDLFSRSLKEIIQKDLLMSSQRTSYQSLQFLRPDITEQENTHYTRKIRIYPTLEQVQIFNKCIGANRYFYNKANAFIKENYKLAYDKRITEVKNLNHCAHYTKRKDKITYCKKPKKENSHFCEKHQDSKLKVDMSYINRIRIREAIITKEQDLTPDIAWQKEVPYDTRQFAIDQCIAAYESNFALIKNGHIKNFDVHFKKKKSINQIFQVNKRAIDFDKLIIFKSKTKKSFRVRKRDLEKIKNGTDCNVTILKTKPNKWYMCLPRIKEPPVYEQAAYKSVFLDPGERTFMTFYSPDGVAGKLGDEFSKEFISPILDKIDKFESLRSKAKGQTRYNMKRRLYKLRDKAKNIVNDLHWKTCNYLCKNFDTIFLPNFKVSEMVEKSKKRVISKKTTRKLLSLSHCDFRKKLKYYATTKHRNVLIVNEAYTTVTCGACGNYKKVGSAKIYKCKCGYEMDRDYHGARNICIRCIT